MKVACFGIVFAFSILPLQALDQDQPALSATERALFRGTKAAGTLAGAALGIYPVAKKAYRYRKVPVIMGAAGAASAVSGSVGAGVGYKAGQVLGSYALAKWHKVGYRVEKISHYYDINIDQYRAILVAAERKDRAALHSAIDQIYSQRFGANWLQLLRDAFNKYGNYPVYLFAIKLSDLSAKEKDVRRMIELGAAIENIYFHKKPSRKDVIRQAARLYPFAGFVFENE